MSVYNAAAVQGMGLPLHVGGEKSVQVSMEGACLVCRAYETPAGIAITSATADQDRASVRLAAFIDCCCQLSPMGQDGRTCPRLAAMRELEAGAGGNRHRR